MVSNGRTISKAVSGVEDGPGALLFDMDGLLLDTETVARDSFVEVADAFGLAGAERFFLELIGSSGAQTSARIGAALAPDADLSRFKADWSAGFEARIAAEVPVKPGVRDVLEALSARGYPMVVVTSTDGQKARRQLGRAGLWPHFRDLVGGNDVTAHKPDPAPYYLGAERAGVAATSCFAFEDSDKGVTAAVAAGCRVWQVPDLRPEGQDLPELGQHVAADLGTAMEAAGLL
ncbi:HAD family phosphatase [Tropicimonas sp. TH_r6]|uniref:HAD family hydrolase n=1 Tax=Tropicimonas sp. TH_r6 TaxID=3082085 RepID=UPI002953BEBA|nr:HAD family phosphatase [Tropicimonas sp. TH_r6]MDV7144928.1 HAD family phosphatase [Tropicimonas sp. TH_r6]